MIVNKHILFWVVYIIFNSIINYYQSTSMFSIQDQIFKYVPSILFFYYSFSIINKFKKELIKLVFLVFLGIILFYLIRFCTYYFNFIQLYFNGEYKINFPKFFLSGLWWWTHYFIYSLFYLHFIKSTKLKDEKIKLNFENYNLEKQNLQLQIINEQLTKQKIEADYNYLRTQINPHFLYNTLGYFYSKVAPIQPQTAEGILMLTNIMRYSLYQGDELGKVPLKMEIENLDNFIGLQKMRFGNSLYLEYEKNVNPGNEYKIIPHLLITIVENAFKHGNYTKPDHPLKVSIALLENKLVVKVENLINKAVSELPSTKTGLQNMQNRLLLVYGNKQNVEIKNDGNIFSIWMQIELNDSIDKVAKESPQSNEAVLNAKPENPNPFYKVAIL